MTGWPLIIFLLLLGGVLSTLGDMLGSRVGKARLSVFKLRPKRTAILITVLTGSFISAISLGGMILASRQLRIGLFKLEDIQKRLQESRLALIPLQEERNVLEEKIKNGEKELKMLEKNLYALRSGDVVISSGQSLVTKTIKIENDQDIKKEIESILQQANYYAFTLAKPQEKPYRRILLVRKDHIDRLEEIISDQRTWVVNIRSAGNILRGENYVYAFPEVRLNKNIVRKGDLIAKTIIRTGNLDGNSINKKIKLLLSSTLAEVKRRGSMSSDLKLNANQINELGNQIISKDEGEYEIKAIALKNSDSADKVSITLELGLVNKDVGE